MQVIKVNRHFLPPLPVYDGVHFRLSVNLYPAVKEQATHCNIIANRCNSPTPAHTRYRIVLFPYPILPVCEGVGVKNKYRKCNIDQLFYPPCMMQQQQQLLPEHHI